MTLTTLPTLVPVTRVRRPSVVWCTLQRHRLAAPGAVLLIFTFLLVLFGLGLPISDTKHIDLMSVFAPPSSQHRLGTDENGRDVLVRLIAGGRVSLVLGLSAALLTVLIGATIGLIATVSLTV